MDPAAWFERLSCSRLFQPQSRCDTNADVGQIGDGLISQESLAIVGRNRENQLEILAVAECVFQRGILATGDSVGPQDGTTLTFLAQMVDVGSESVTHVDHGMEPGVRVKDLRLTDSRCEIEMMAANAITKRSGREQPIAWPRTSPSDRSVSLRLPQEGDGDDQRALPTIGITADQSGIELVSELAHAEVKFTREIDTAVSGQDDTHESSNGSARHRRDVTEIDGQGLATNSPRFDFPQPKIDTIGQNVGRGQNRKP